MNVKKKTITKNRTHAHWFAFFLPTAMLRWLVRNKAPERSHRRWLVEKRSSPSTLPFGCIDRRWRVIGGGYLVLKLNFRNVWRLECAVKLSLSPKFLHTQSLVSVFSLRTHTNKHKQTQAHSFKDLEAKCEGVFFSAVDGFFCCFVFIFYSLVCLLYCDFFSAFFFCTSGLTGTRSTRERAWSKFEKTRASSVNGDISGFAPKHGLVCNWG